MADLRSTKVFGDLTVTNDAEVKSNLSVGGVISGDGSGITSLDAENLVGKIPAANLDAVVSQNEAETGTSTTSRRWTAQRVRQAIAAWWNGYSSSIGKSLATAQTAQEARQIIGATTGGDVTDQLGQMAFLDKASQAQAEAGTSDSVGVTPVGVTQRLNQFGIPEPIKLTASDDLDDVRSPGTYAHTMGSKPENTPLNLAGTLKVDVNSGFIKQRWFARDENREFHRWWRNDQGVWSDWTETWTKDNLPQSSINNWNTAYGWGNHASAGYLTSVTWADVSGKPAQATRWPTFAEVTGKPSTYAPTIGTTASTAKAGNWLPSWGDIQSKPAVIAAGATQAAARQAIGAAAEGSVGDVSAAGDNTFTGSNTFTKRIKTSQFGGVEIGPGGNGTSVISNNYSELEISHEAPSATISLAVRYDGIVYHPLAATKDGVTLRGEDGNPSAMSTSPSNGGLLVYNGVTGDAFTAERVATTSDLNLKANASTTISAGPGLTGGGNLSANRTLSVNFGTTAGTAAQGNDSRIINGQTAYSWGNFRDFGLGRESGAVNLTELTSSTPNGFYRVLEGVSGAPFSGALIVASYDGTPTKRAVLIGHNGALATAHVEGSDTPTWVEQAPKPSRVSFTSSKGMSKSDDGMVLFPADGVGSYTVNQNIRTGSTIGICTSLMNTSLTITPGSGFTLVWMKGGSSQSGARTVAPKSTVTLIQQNSNTWVITGNGIS